MKFILLSFLFYPLYILPSQSILKKCSEKIIHFKSPVLISGEGERKFGEESVKFDIKILLDGKNFKVEATFPGGKEVIIKNVRRTARIVGNREIPLTTSFAFLPEILNLLFFSTDYSLEKFGVDTSVVSFTREKKLGIISFSLGAKDGFLLANQFWVNKNSFLPVRFIYIKEEKVYDIKFTGFIVKDGEKFMPDRFEFSDPEGEGSMIFKIWNPFEKLDPSVFEIPPAEKQEPENEESIEELIKRFEGR